MNDLLILFTGCILGWLGRNYLVCDECMSCQNKIYSLGEEEKLRNEDIDHPGCTGPCCHPELYASGIKGGIAPKTVNEIRDKFGGITFDVEDYANDILRIP